MFDRVVGVDPAFQIVATFGLGDRHPERAAREVHGRHRRASTSARSKTATHQDQRHDQHRLAAADHAARPRSACSVRSRCSSSAPGSAVPSARPRTTRTRPADGHRHRAGLRRRDGARRSRRSHSPGCCSGARSSFDPFIGPARLIFAFEAVIIGGLGSLWGTLVGGIILGVSRRRSAARSIRSGASSPDTSCSLRCSCSVRPACSARPSCCDDRRPRVRCHEAPTSFRVVRGTTTSRVFGLVAVLVVGLLAFMPSWGDASLQRKMVELLTLLALAEMWNLLAGFAGVVSVGQQAFVGLGAYSMVAFVNVHGQNLYWSVPSRAPSSPASSRSRSGSSPSAFGGATSRSAPGCSPRW